MFKKSVLGVLLIVPTDFREKSLVITPKKARTATDGLF
jgi:hypothetical protein